MESPFVITVVGNIAPEGVKVRMGLAGTCQFLFISAADNDRILRVQKGLGDRQSNAGTSACNENNVALCFHFEMCFPLNGACSILKERLNGWCHLRVSGRGFCSGAEKTRAREMLVGRVESLTPHALFDGGLRLHKAMHNYSCLFVAT